MTFLLGGGRTQSKQSPAVSGLQVQTSSYGKVITIAYGTIRLSPNLLWYGDFLAIKHAISGGKGGIAGGGGGKGGGGGYTYTYSASVMFGLCEGPIQNVLNVYKDKAKVTPAFLGMDTSDGTYPQTPWSFLSTNHGYLNETSTIPGSPYQIHAKYYNPFLLDNGVITNITLLQISSGAPTTSQYLLQRINQDYVYSFNSSRAGKSVTFALGGGQSQVVAIPAVSPYTITLSQHASKVQLLNLALTKVASGPTSGQYSVSATGLYTFAAADTGTQVTISYQAGDQSPAFEALGYNGIAWAAAANYDLGNSPSLSNHNFEVVAAYGDLIQKATAPAAPALSSVASGALAATTYYVSATWVTANGETTAVGETNQACLVNHLVHVTAPGSAPAGVTGWNCYISNTASGGSGFQTLQNSTPISVGVDFQLPTTGLVAGADLPTINTSGNPDADPSLVVVDFLTNDNYGSGYPAGKIGDLTTYQNYTLAAGLLLSFALESQQSAASVLEEIALVTNSEWINGGLGSLTLVPYGDSSLTGNGKTYTPPGAPLYDLTDDDFIASGNEAPVVRNRKRATDSDTWIQMEFRDRAKDYNPSIAEAKNQAWIDLFKLRPKPNNGSTNRLFANATAANLSVRLQLQRSYILNTYTFKTDQRYIVLDPMDIVTLTDSVLGLSAHPVRIKRISESGDNELSFEAEDYLAGIGSSPQYSFQTTNGYNPDYNVSPGNVNTPILFEAPVQIATNTGLETWILASGGTDWGGCQVYASSDGLAYGPIGRITGQGRQGVIVADTGTTVTVDMTESRGQLLSGSATDAAQGNTLCYCDGELFSYTTAVLIAPYQYTLSGLVRAQYGTTQQSFTAGDIFGRIDDQVLSFPYDKTQIGQTIFVKFLSFNLFGGGSQNLSDVQPYLHTVVGPPAPPRVTNFTVQQQTTVVSFSWTDVNDFAVRGYNISYAPQTGPGAGYDNSVLLTFASRATEVTTAQVPPGCWTFYIVAIDIAGQVSGGLVPDPASQDLCITNNNSVLNDFNSYPTWPDDGTNKPFEFYKTFDGKFVPKGTKTCDQYVQISPPAAPTVYEVAGSTLSARTYFVTITYVTTGGDETTESSTTVFAVDPNFLAAVTSPPASGIATHYNVYAHPGTGGGTETLQNADPIPCGTDWEEPNTGLIVGAARPTQNTTGWEVFDDFIPDVTSLCYYFTPEVDLGKSGTVRAWVILSWALGPSQTDFPATMNDFPSFLFYGPNTPVVPSVAPNSVQAYTVTFVTGRYFQSQFEFLFVDGGVPYFNNIEVVLDSEIEVFNVNGVASLAAGTVVTFASLGLSFFVAPNVVANPAVAGVTSCVATNITATQFTLTGYNGATAVDATSDLIISGA